MKILYTKISILLLALFSSNITKAQCASSSSLSSANNMFGIIRNTSNPVAVDKDLNTIVFVHRHNSNVFGGNSGMLRYDISTDAGATWTSNIGPLNPASSNQVARYPNGLIYNPSGNTNTLNAYVGYLAATTNTFSGSWSVLNTGGRLLSGTNNTEVYNQPNTSSNFIAGSLVKGAPGVFWALDQTSTGATTTGGVLVYKGIWNSNSNSIIWSLNTTLYPPFNPNVSGDVIGEFYIAFDPTGNIGWIGMMADVTNNFDYAYYPVFYKTINGGNSWTGPITVDLNTISCISNNIGFFPGANSECNLVVDFYGNPHLLGVFGENDGSYDIYGSMWHTVMDITYNGTSWVGLDVSGVNGDEALIVGNSGNTAHEVRPQISRSADGKKIFYTWTDNSTYSLGSPNSSPNLFAKAYDVQVLNWTPIKDFTSCNPLTSGKILFPHVAKEVLEPSSGIYKLAPFYGEFVSTINVDFPVNYKFLDNCTFAASDFSITQSNSLNLSILPSNNIILCPGNVVNLQLIGSFSSILWSNGSQSNIANVNLPGIYSVMASSGCSSGTASITVNTLTFSASSSSAMICEGNSVILNVVGNAHGYTWTPGTNLTGTSVVVSPTTNTTYTVKASGDGCNANSQITISLSAAPNILAISNKTMSCAGEEVILQATGTDIYVWSTSDIGKSITVYPTVNTTYSVTGTNSLGCSTTFSIEQLVSPCLNLNSNENNQMQLIVYPNPNNGKMTIKGEYEISLKLINALGETIKTIFLDEKRNYSLTVENLPRGIYFILGNRNNQPLTHKIVVE